MVQLRILKKRRQKYKMTEWYKDKLEVPIQTHSRWVDLKSNGVKCPINIRF